MNVELYNAGVEPFLIEQNGIKKLIQPCESQKVVFDNDTGVIKLTHVNKDKLNVLWYSLNALFALEQMRTVLVVEGEYILKPSCEDMIVKVKNHEYVFEKHTSYETFVFAVKGGEIHRKHLEVANADKIIKKAKFLYLFGGNKSFLLFFGIALLALLIEILLASSLSGWFWIELVFAVAMFLILCAKYKKSLKILRKAVKTENILKYMHSSRNEYRKFSDELVQKHLDANAGNDIYR